MLHVVHHPNYVVPWRGEPVADKYGLVMHALAESGASYTVHSPDPMPRAWIEAVHDPAYVAEVAAAAVPAAKERRIGYAITKPIARRSAHVPGGTWLAALRAIEHGHAANAAGGSHHALYETGAGYCVFNDLAIVAHRLVAEGVRRRVLIVDLDVHQGDGTAALLAGRRDLFTFSIHAEKNFPHRKAQSDLDVALPDRVEDDEYLAILAAHLPALLDGFAPDMVLYQAGVDPHRDDRLGRLALSDAGLAARDTYVIEEARRRGVPVASTLGGGYAAERVDIARRHVRSMLTMAQANAAFA